MREPLCKGLGEAVIVTSVMMDVHPLEQLSCLRVFSPGVEDNILCVVAPVRTGNTGSKFHPLWLIFHRETISQKHKVYPNNIHCPFSLSVVVI